MTTLAEALASKFEEIERMAPEVRRDQAQSLETFHQSNQRCFSTQQRAASRAVEKIRRVDPKSVAPLETRMAEIMADYRSFSRAYASLNIAEEAVASSSATTS